MSQADMYAMLWRADMGYLYLAVLTAVVLGVGWWQRARLAGLAAWKPSPLLLITLGGLLLRLPRLGESLWYDETFTARIASLDAAQFMPAVVGDVHPPLFYALDWITARLLGDGEAALRLPALVFGVLLIPCAFRLARALNLTERTALVYAGLVALMPSAIYYSHEARGYSLLALLAFCALIGLLEDRPRFYLAHAALLPLVHNIGFVYLAVFSLIGFWRWIAGARHAVPLQKGFVLGVALIPGALWLPTMLAQSSDIADGFWLQPFNAGLGLSILTDTTVSRALHFEFALPVTMAAIGATLAGLFVYRRWIAGTPEGRAWAALALGVPVLLALAAWLWAPVYLTRALLPAGLALVLLWAMLLVHKPLSRVFIPAALALALVSFYTPGMGRFDFRTAAKACASSGGVYAASIPAALYAGYYLPNAELRIWEDAGDLNQTLQRGAQAAMNLIPGELDNLPAPRCIVVLETSQTTDAERAHLAALLAGRSYHQSEWRVNQFYTVRLIEL